MKEFFMRNRWLIALAAIGLHISIGSVYAWSVLTRPIMVDTGFTLSQTTWTFFTSHSNAWSICRFSWILCREDWS